MINFILVKKIKISNSVRNLKRVLSLFASFVNLLLAFDHRKGPCTIIGDGRGGAETGSCAASPPHSWTLMLHQRSSYAALESWIAHQDSFETIDGLYSWLSQSFTMVAYSTEIAVSISCFSHLRSWLDSESGMSFERLIDAVLVLSCSPILNTV